MCERAPLREWLMAYTRCGVVGQWCMHGLWTACMGCGLRVWGVGGVVRGHRCTQTTWLV